LDYEPTSTEYFTFTVQQVAFVTLCGGNPDTLEGRDPEIGKRIVNNGLHIINTYWRTSEDSQRPVTAFLSTVRSAHGTGKRGDRAFSLQGVLVNRTRGLDLLAGRACGVLAVKISVKKEPTDWEPTKSRFVVSYEK
jgi:hypothetical protein